MAQTKKISKTTKAATPTNGTAVTVPDVEAVTVTVDGITVTVDPDIFDDFDILDDLRVLRDGDPLQITAVFRKIFGDEQTKTIRAEYVKRAGRFRVTTAIEFVVEVMQVASPK